MDTKQMTDTYHAVIEQAFGEYIEQYNKVKGDKSEAIFTGPYTDASRPYTCYDILLNTTVFQRQRTKYIGSVTYVPSDEEHEYIHPKILMIINNRGLVFHPEGNDEQALRIEVLKSCNKYIKQVKAVNTLIRNTKV